MTKEQAEQIINKYENYNLDIKNLEIKSNVAIKRATAQKQVDKLNKRLCRLFDLRQLIINKIDDNDYLQEVYAEMMGIDWNC